MVIGPLVAKVSGHCDGFRVIDARHEFPTPEIAVFREPVIDERLFNRHETYAVLGEELWNLGFRRRKVLEIELQRPHAIRLTDTVLFV